MRLIERTYKYMIIMTLLAVWATAIYYQLPKKCESVLVVQVGACNFMGECAIIGVDGLAYVANMPMVGKFADTKCEVSLGD